MIRFFHPQGVPQIHIERTRSRLRWKVGDEPPVGAGGSRFRATGRSQGPRPVRNRLAVDAQREFQLCWNAAHPKRVRHGRLRRYHFFPLFRNEHHVTRREDIRVMPPKPQSAIVRVVPNSLPEEAIVIGKTSQAIACSNGMQHPHPPFCPVRRPRCNGQSDSIAEPAIPKGPVRGCRIGTAHRSHHRRTKKGRGCGQSMAPNGVLEIRTHRNRSCNARSGQVFEARVATVESSKVRLPEGAHAPHLWLTLWGRAGNPHRVVLKA